MDLTNERGNVLWLVMIAVVLLAVLTMVLSRSGSSVETMADREKVAIEALALMRYARSIEAAVDHMVLQGVSENDISFQNPISTTDYTNANCTDDACRVFHIGGAGLSYVRPKAIWLDSAYSAQTYYGDWLFTGNVCVADVGRGDDNCDGSTRNLELIAVLPYVKESLCQAVNKQVKMVLTNPVPVNDEAALWNGASAHYVGTFDNPAVLMDGDEDLRGQTTGCFGGAGTPPSGSYHFYHVVKAR